MNVNISSLLKRPYHFLTNAYVLFMFSIFLFVFHDYYFDMTPCKLLYFQTASMMLIGGCMLCAIVSLFTGKQLQIKQIKESISTFSICDWAFLCMLVSHIITTLFSPYQMESITGSEARGMGLLFTFLITFVYFMISRYYDTNGIAFPVLLGSCIPVVILAVLNFFGVDPLHFFDRVKPEEIWKFISTIGNITFFAHLICLTLPISICYYITNEGRKKALSVCSCTIGFIGLFVANLDGAYLGMGAYLIWFFYRSCNSYENVKRMLELGIIGISATKILWLLSLFFPSEHRGFLGISSFIVPNSFMWVVLALMVSIYVYIYREDVHPLPYHQIRMCFISAVFFIILIFLGIFMYFSCIDRSTDLGSMENYLRFSDSWGTGRGIVWDRLLTIYKDEFSFMEKLFGSGLDTARILMRTYFSLPEYDNAHNEYIQYLVTSGIFGLITYMTILLSSIIRLIKYGKQEPMMIAIAGALIAHSAQAITGLNQPITTPLVFIFIAIGEAFVRNEHKNKTKQPAS